MSTITFEHGSLKIKTPYNASLIAALKTLPTSDRKYDPASKSWLVAAQYGGQVSSWIEQYLGEIVLVPQATHVTQKDVMDIFEVRYIGLTKDRGETERSAFGFYRGEWSVMFPENVLRDWFEQPAVLSDETNLYALLSINQHDTPDVLKSAYRRLARQWHPDVCKEPDATQQFQKIQNAYDILSDANKRAKYDAGLALAAQVSTRHDAMDYSSGYRSPLRCGLLMCQGHWSLGRFIVSQILKWEDVVNSKGQTLVTSWPAGADKFTEAWV